MHSLPILEGIFLAVLLVSIAFVDGAFYANEPLAKNDESSVDYAKISRELVEKQRKMNLVFQNTIEAQQADNEDLKSRLMKKNTRRREGHDKHKLDDKRNTIEGQRPVKGRRNRREGSDKRNLKKGSSRKGNSDCNPFSGNTHGIGTGRKSGKGGTKLSCAYSCVGGRDLDACGDNTSAEIGTAACIGDNACINASGKIGDGSCVGGIQEDDGDILSVCGEATDATIGDNSCIGTQACKFLAGSTVGNKSCVGSESCLDNQGIEVGNGSCYGTYACDAPNGSTIGHYSCVGFGSCDQYFEEHKVTIQDKSCIGDYACSEVLADITIEAGSCNNEKFRDTSGNGVCQGIRFNVGKGSCNCDGCCQGCTQDVPNDACNGVDQTAPCAACMV
jgi:acetyltransferase-like isoleucine patch superfamily enzyme